MGLRWGGVGLHQRLALSPFMFAVITDRLTDEVRQKSPWIMMFARPTLCYLSLTYRHFKLPNIILFSDLIG